MIEILFSFFAVPFVFADHNLPSFYVAVQQELYENVELLQQDSEMIEERGNDVNTRTMHGSSGRLPKTPVPATEGFARVLPLEFVHSDPTPLSMITNNSAISFFLQNKNRQIAAAASVFQLNNNTILNQNVSMARYFGYINTLILKMTAAQQKPEPLPEEPKQKFIQVMKGCALTVNDDCLIARSGAGDEFEELYKLRINVLLEVDEIVENEDGEVWYKIKHEENIPHPERIGGEWFVPDTHVSLIEMSDEPDFNIEKKIVVDISEQKVRAYEGDELVIEDAVSTGLSGRHATPIGEFDILKKQASRYMQAPAPGIQDWYDLPGVPYVMYFSDSGDALHCAYWHDKFGRRWSHGCVNTSCETARLLYEWTATGTKMHVQW